MMLNARKIRVQAFLLSEHWELLMGSLIMLRFNALYESHQRTLIWKKLCGSFTEIAQGNREDISLSYFPLEEKQHLILKIFPFTPFSHSWLIFFLQYLPFCSPMSCYSSSTIPLSVLKQQMAARLFLS